MKPAPPVTRVRAMKVEGALAPSGALNVLRRCLGFAERVIGRHEGTAPRSTAKYVSGVTRRVLQLLTERLVVEVPGVSAAEHVADYCRRNRSHLGPWEPARPLDYHSRSFWVRQLRAALDEFHAGQSVRTVIRLRHPGAPHGAHGSERVIGVANLSQIVRGAFQSAVFGYSLDEEMVGQGLMHEALERILRYAFDDLQLHRVMAAYRPENDRSAAVLERLGFEKEGFARDYLFIDGAWRDHVLTALIRPAPDKARPSEADSAESDRATDPLRSRT